MEGTLGFLERQGSGRDEYWTLRPRTRRALIEVMEPSDEVRDWAAIKDAVLDVIRGGAMRGEAPLANAAIRRMTKLDRQQVNRLIHELADDGQVRIEGHGRGARYVFTGPPNVGA